MLKTITLYTRERCSLCDKARAAIERVRALRAFELVVIDLDRDASLDKKAAYDLEVPVIELDGRKVMKYRIDESRLARLLDAS
jgi:glutaredoxin